MKHILNLQILLPCKYRSTISLNFTSKAIITETPEKYRLLYEFITEKMRKVITTRKLHKKCQAAKKMM